MKTKAKILALLLLFAGVGLVRAEQMVVIVNNNSYSRVSQLKELNNLLKEGWKVIMESSSEEYSTFVLERADKVVVIAPAKVEK